MRKFIRWFLILVVVIYNIIGVTQILSPAVYEGVDEFLHDLSFPFYLLALFSSGIADSFLLYFLLQGVIAALVIRLILFLTRQRKMTSGVSAADPV